LFNGTSRGGLFESGLSSGALRAYSARFNPNANDFERCPMPTTNRPAIVRAYVSELLKAEVLQAAGEQCCTESDLLRRLLISWAEHRSFERLAERVAGTETTQQEAA
jgi:hypothetical protein